MCLGGPGAGAGAGIGMPGSDAASIIGGGMASGMPLGVPGAADADVALGSSFDGQGMINGQPFGGLIMGPPAPTPGVSTGLSSSDVTMFNAAKTVLGLLGKIAVGGSLPLMGLPLAVAGWMAGQARGAGQPPGQMGMMGQGIPETGLSVAGLTQGLPGLSVGEQNLKAAEPRPVAMPMGDITSSMLSVPSPKVDLSSLMASRGIRGAGTKAASPEWFQKGKRGY